ncbi:flavin reductase family protein [Gayadomonas joobiniege]|uniref:flavin reductase family protein n=1 Tax=Gayadomonas joobiniege TaxID=1234606 RepID=UPI00038149B3|nr:flavin reductase family protein [Gayadomonas joobiniege]
MQLDFSKLSSPQAYFAMTQMIVPRPIAWVLSEHETGGYNLAPYSFFNAICSAPPLLMYSAGKRKSGEKKDSVANVERTQKAVIHIASADLVQQVQDSAQPIPPDQSEVDLCKLELTDFDGFSLPRVAACPVAFACELYKLDTIGEQPQTLVYMQIIQAYINDKLMYKDDKQRNKVNSLALNPLARLGAGEFASLGEIIMPEV